MYCLSTLQNSGAKMKPLRDPEVMTDRDWVLLLTGDSGDGNVMK